VLRFGSARQVKNLAVFKFHNIGVLKNNKPIACQTEERSTDYRINEMLVFNNDTCTLLNRSLNDAVSDL
jgi:hypothetical protein